MLIGVVGFMGSGKGTLGDVLVTQYGYQQDSWARPLKDAASSIFGWERNMVEGDTKDSRLFREEVDEFWSRSLNDPEFTPRKALQLMGTEAGRMVFGESLWTSSLINRWEKSGRPNTVITDCRFRNELDAVKEHGGIIVRVVRGDEPHWWDLIEQANRGDLTQLDLDNISNMRKRGEIPHVSETDWVGYEFEKMIFNNGSLEDFQNNIRQFIDDISKESK